MNSLRTERMTVPPIMTPPVWASDWGEDARFGVWAELRVRGVRVRFRWIPPGRFIQGSPEAEQGRLEREGPQREVTFSRRFWLAETPTTQEFWEGVMATNPSRFKSADRPVEQVSWEDAQEFIARLRELVPGFEARLPSEAEWEYACRAETTTSTYAGELEIVGERNAPLLDTVAWYGGNSGVGYELEEGHDSSDWSEKQHNHKKAGTHPVGKKDPNRLGLYDMLGNVFEWCEDAWDFDEGYPKGDVTDPTPVTKGAERVCRGGSWLAHARHVRAAFRFGVLPGFRGGYLGFRLAEGSVPVRRASR